MKNLIKSTVLFLYLLADRLVSKFSFSGNHKNKIVLVVRMDNIGDYVVWRESLKELQANYSDYRLVLVCNQSYASFARDCDEYKKVIGVNVKRLEKSLLYRWKMLWKVRQINAEIALQPTFSRSMFTGDSIIRASAASHRIGSVGDYANITRKHKSISDKWYTHLVSATTGNLTEFERNVEFLNGIGIAGAKPAIAKLDCGSVDVDSLGLSGEYFIVFPGASWVGRMWPQESFATLLNRIAEKYNMKPVLCGSPAEFDICERIIELSGNSAARNLAGITSLQQFAEVVKNSSLLVGNETSAVHIAASADTPSICILGGGHFGRFMPYPESVSGQKPTPVYFNMPCYGCNWLCTQPHNPDECVPCISNITVESVVSAVDDIMLAS